jgi:hypothetical protein
MLWFWQLHSCQADLVDSDRLFLSLPTEAITSSSASVHEEPSRYPALARYLLPINNPWILAPVVSLEIF